MAKDLNYVDYKDIEYLQRFINEQGKILPRRGHEHLGQDAAPDHQSRQTGASPGDVAVRG